MYQCNHCDHMCARKYNLKVHKRNKHGEVLTTKKNTAKCEKNRWYSTSIKKIELLLKKTVAAGVDIDAMKRNVNSLADPNVNKFNLLAQDYKRLSRFEGAYWHW